MSCLPSFYLVKALELNFHLQQSVH